ncbi:MULTISPECIES: hypothetical protein [Ferroplasma]|uniref:Transposase IS4-like domain-containing protein n=4 Tax=Ferroplasma TaxID=74968 RepID=S0ARJ8_FERAC|nr:MULTISPECIES: hypothetical protein [Ferroplasma]AGO61813.1 hypothetical protein FACI_IFERC00001G1835 [Ferroplasma acidarmanus Fer1]ARD84707.1 transposase IS4 family protein [Ferroplasma acidiphilum]WMT53657.1 MAG: hypothetical protein RE473_02130 [Ferroplasma acidiphilum]
MATEHLEIKKIKGQNYAYSTVNLWDRENKKEIKISKYIGKVNGNNEIIRKVNLPDRSYQYGDVAFLVSMNYNLIKKISENYDKYWKEIITSALITIVGRIPLEYVKGYYRKTILYHYWPKLKLEPKNITSMLRYLAYNKLAFENLEEYDDSSLIMHVEIVIPVYAFNGKSRYARDNITLDIVFEPAQMRILNVEYFTGSEYMLSRFISRTEEAAKYDGVLILDSLHSTKKDINLLIRENKFFIVELSPDETKKFLDKVDPSGKTMLRRSFNSLLNRSIYYYRISMGNLHYFIMDDAYHGESESIKVSGNSSIMVALSNMDIDQGLVYQAINIKRFMYSSISSSKYRLDSDRKMISGKMELDGYVLFNIIAMKFYMSLYRNTIIPNPGRHKLVDSLMIELSTINMYLVKGELYLPRIGKSIMSDLNSVGGGIADKIFSKDLFSELNNKK